MSNDLEKLSDRRLADEFGLAKKDADASADRLKALKAELERRNKPFLKGSRYDVARVPKSRKQLNTEAIAAAMGEPWLAKWKTKVSSWLEWAVTDKLADAPDAVEPEPQKKAA